MIYGVGNSKDGSSTSRLRVIYDMFVFMVGDCLLDKILLGKVNLGVSFGSSSISNLLIYMLLLPSG